MNRINLIILLDKLEDIIDNAPEIPLTGRVLLDSDELLELIEKILISAGITVEHIGNRFEIQLGCQFGLGFTYSW